MARQTLVALFDEFRHAESAIHEIEALAIPAARLAAATPGGPALSAMNRANPYRRGSK